MSPWADTAALAALAVALGRSGELLRQDAAVSMAVLGAHGYWWAAADTESSIDRLTMWVAEWETSLRSRIAILEAADALPLGGPVRWAPSPVDRRALAALGLLGGAGGGAVTSTGLLPWRVPSGDVESGRLLAAELEAAVDAGQTGRVFDVLRALEAVADQPATAVGFINRLGLDTLRVFPAMLTNHLGVPLVDLHRHLLPIGRALAAASRASDPPLSFGGGELMAEEAGASLGPAVYFDFGDFDPGFLVDATVAFPHLRRAAPDDGGAPLCPPRRRLCGRRSAGGPAAGNHLGRTRVDGGTDRPPGHRGCPGVPDPACDAISW